MASAADAEANPFPFPREYFFPPMFTRQPNLTTLHAQRTKWSAMVLAYARHHRLFRLSISAAAESDLFNNKRINRRMDIPDIHDIFDFMAKEGRAEYAAGTPGDVVFVYWRTPSEWAQLIESFVEDTGQKGSVLTLYELAHGEGTRSTELHGIDSDVLLKALSIVVKKGKARIFGEDDSQGVKFF